VLYYLYSILHHNLFLQIDKAQKFISNFTARSKSLNLSILCEIFIQCLHTLQVCHVKGIIDKIKVTISLTNNSVLTLPQWIFYISKPSNHSIVICCCKPLYIPSVYPFFRKMLYLNKWYDNNLISVINIIPIISLNDWDVSIILGVSTTFYFLKMTNKYLLLNVVGPQYVNVFILPHFLFFLLV
jgi:hypothetical protein